MTEQEILQHIDGMITTLLSAFPEAFKKGENTDDATSKLFQNAIEALLRYSIKLGERKAIEKARNWVILNTTTEFLHAHEHDDYPISYVRVVGIKDTIELMNEFTNAMEKE
jgi:hypothetical protein